VSDDRGDAVEQRGWMAVQAGKRHDDPVHEAVDHQRVADSREPGMVEQCGKLPARGIEDGGRRKRNQEMEGQAEHACCPAVLKGCSPEQTARDALQQAHWMDTIWESRPTGRPRRCPRRRREVLRPRWQEAQANLQSARCHLLQPFSPRLAPRRTSRWWRGSRCSHRVRDRRRWSAVRPRGYGGVVPRRAQAR
jgi:hypothetical protein